uniref:Uncharacterized protein n=1 Tax=Oryza meridionalis TaxID=40149 RepID=A0A0E0C9H0_9ORYZ
MATARGRKISPPIPSLRVRARGGFCGFAPPALGMMGRGTEKRTVEAVGDGKYLGVNRVIERLRILLRGPLVGRPKLCTWVALGPG